MTGGEGVGERVTLHTEARLGEDRVHVSWTFENGGDRDLFMYTHPDDGRRAEVLPGAYVCVSREREELRLLLGIPPAPRHFDVQRGVVPLARIVTPGGRIEGSLDVELPVREWSAYLPPDYPSDSPTVLVDRGSLTVEYFPTEGAGWVEPGPAPGTFWTEALEPRSITSDFRFARSIPVLERTDPFVRF